LNGYWYMNRSGEIDKIDLVFVKTLELISLYKSHHLTVPFGLKGNLGEFIVQLELLKRFPSRTIDFRGGSYPSVDILLDNKKIQVKTQIKHPPQMFRNGFVDFESSPTIKKNILDGRKCDFLILVILYPNEEFATIDKTHVYIFDHADFGFFDTKFCWSGNSKGDYTIVRVLNVEGIPPKGLGEKIAFYKTPLYEELFKNSQDNWSKIDNSFSR
jgi:hypothetical protein